MFSELAYQFRKKSGSHQEVREVLGKCSPSQQKSLIMGAWRNFFAIILGILIYQTQIHKKLEVLLKNTDAYNEFLEYFSVSTSGNDLNEDKNIFHLAKMNLTMAQENEEGFQEVSKKLYEAFNKYCRFCIMLLNLEGFSRQITCIYGKQFKQFLATVNFLG